MRLKYLSLVAKKYLLVLKGFFGRGPLLNYCIEKNAGDSFNKDFIFDKCKCRVRLYSGGKRKHFLFCGSVLGRSNKNSIILGAGFISEEQAERKLSFSRIIGVRGNLSADRILIKNKNVRFQFKGDPGLLAREIVRPRGIEHKSTGVVGVIPHFIDYELVAAMVPNNSKYHIIDIKDDYKKVCKDILKCDEVISSSLHGLIFSDAMKVPSSWVRFSEKLIGGNFKFNDYYSTMSNPQSAPFICKNINDLESVRGKAMVSEHTGYLVMRDAIISTLGKLKG